jgi:hypothetical protein
MKKIDISLKNPTNVIVSCKLLHPNYDTHVKGIANGFLPFFITRDTTYP